MKASTALRNGFTRLLRFSVLVLLLLVALLLLPILLLVGALNWLWRFFQRWRYRRGFASRFGRQGKKAVFVYSNSPHWKARIESEILPRIAPRAVILNWSERSTHGWKPRPLEVRIFEHWGGSSEFNPLAIVFPEDGPVQVVRFWQAYREYKHGKPGLLQEKERELFDALEVPIAERPP